ncbi:glycosyltransferase [Crossiella sp. SN42]|uniref:glycosyltransferase n=1 Tax=Crossiella sp. SN42 TaxID=2944808 RepID=UPI00207D2FDA|nr:glycosyltransferase [Crossiella sp. SN42]MCO1577279.1 glycosyltransferase [Crossiella sp. SN42]
MTEAPRVPDGPSRVLLVNGNYQDGTVGGTQSFTERLARQLHEVGRTVGVLCLGESDAVERHEGVTVFRLRPPRLTGLAGSAPVRTLNQLLAMQNPWVARRVAAVLARFRPQLCHVQMLRTLTPSALRVLTAHPGLAVVQTTHELFSLWDFDPFLPDLPHKIYSRPPRAIAPITQRHKRISAGVDHVCAPSAFALNAYTSRGYFAGVPATVLPNSAPHEWGPPRELAARRLAAPPAARPRFLFVARLDHYKGVEVLLDALTRVPELDIAVDIAGEGVKADLVRERAALDPRITYHGPVRGQARLALFRRADVMVCPSTWTETYCLAAAEAFAAAMPVIGTSVGALPETVRHGRTGLIVEPGDPAGLAEAIRRLADPAHRIPLITPSAEQAHANAPSEFLARQLAVYSEALRPRGFSLVSAPPR